MNYKDKIEAAINQRRTPSERLQNVSKAFEEIAEQSNSVAAKQILAELDGVAAEDVDPTRAAIMTEAVQRVSAGDWTDLLAVSVGSFGGAFVGRYAHKVVDLNPGGFPVIGVAAAAAGAATSLLVMDKMRLGVRAAVASAGAGVLAGNLIRLNKDS